MLPPLASSGAESGSKKNLLSSAPSNEKRNKIEPIGTTSTKALTQRDEHQPPITTRDESQTHETEKASEQAPMPEKQ
jgi:hypothetical protein